jgi:RNA polymerase sigma factor (TIGR02999 family)
VTTPSLHSVTQLLLAWGQGDQAALQQLIPLVYAELRRLAKRHLRQERAGHILQTTALVHEAYLRLIDWQQVEWQNRAHFLGVAAQLMRRILVDDARRRRALKRGAEGIQVSLTEAAEVAEERSVDLLALEEALQSLAELDARKSRIVELRFFGGLSVEETAEVMKISPRTVRREWSLAQAWLHRELRPGSSPDRT